jgi:hypothetical protein
MLHPVIMDSSPKDVTFRDSNLNLAGREVPSGLEMLYHIGWLYVNGAQQLAAQGDGLHGSCVNLWMDISEGRIEDIPSGKHTKNYRTSPF